jgi:hypothetical protein
MRIAFGLTSHKFPDQVRNLTEVLRGFGHVFLHHDGNAPPLPRDIRTQGGVSEVRRRRTYWGTFHLVDVFIDVMENALADGFEHVIFLSAQDLPVAGAAGIRAMLLDGDFQMTGGPAPLEPGSAHARRYERRWHFVPAKGNRVLWISYNVAHRAQRSFRSFGFSNTVSGFHWSFRDVAPLFPVYKADTWFSLNASAMEHVLRTNHLDARVEWFRHTLIPEEAFFASVLMNSGLRLGDARRFADFEGGAAHPRLITAADLPALERREVTFARKFDPVVDPENYRFYLERARALV